jgi:hypothetical protein
MYIVTCLHFPFRGNGSIDTFPRQQMRMQQLRALLEVVLFYAVSAEVMY